MAPFAYAGRPRTQGTGLTVWRWVASAGGLRETGAVWEGLVGDRCPVLLDALCAAPSRLALSRASEQELASRRRGSWGTVPPAPDLVGPHYGRLLFECKQLRIVITMGWAYQTSRHITFPIAALVAALIGRDCPMVRNSWQDDGSGEQLRGVEAAHGYLGRRAVRQ